MTTTASRAASVSMLRLVFRAEAASSVEPPPARRARAGSSAGSARAHTRGAVGGLGDHFVRVVAALATDVSACPDTRPVK